MSTGTEQLIEQLLTAKRNVQWLLDHEAGLVDMHGLAYWAGRGGAAAQGSARVAMSEHERIRWTDNGYGGLIGSVGSIDPWLFQIYDPASPSARGEWLLTSALPGQIGKRSYAEVDDRDSLKTLAEQWLAEFIEDLDGLCRCCVNNQCECIPEAA